MVLVHYSEIVNGVVESMDIREIEVVVAQLLEEVDGNYVKSENAMRPVPPLLRMFDSALVGVSSASDTLFTKTCKRPEVVGPHFITPIEWLSEAKSVISIFFNFTTPVIASNITDPIWPSYEWLYARYEGQMFINRMMSELQRFLQTKGFTVVVPSSDSRFMDVNVSTDTRSLSGMSFTSVWSERHVAYASGLGTFGLSKGLITRNGVAGRFGSIVTSLSLDPTARRYSGIYEYCSMCGKCAANCPAEAITLKRGKDHFRCNEFGSKIKEKFSPRLGCGNCQVGVPCQKSVP